ncbi:uncharacterized protein LOC127290039 [Leptopilina boulardi]|uniref:uncharacterized protein LOC127290039 n=1 Tax=Leptopilina boulardi TaxID=63433 RepID=UPI0021F65AAA|nr:uncharacterized protein LOC127290039 [Leptopilina boulardi]
MYKGELSINLFIFAGVWRPINLSLFIMKFFYNILTIFIIILFYFFDISLCIYLILHSLNNIDEFAESLCWFLAAIVTCVKMTNFILRRNDIIKLINILNAHCLKTRDNIEKIMQDKCDFTARRNTKYFFIITSATVLAMTCGGLAKGKDNISLPLKASLPYDYKNQKLAFSLTYISQSLWLYLSGLVTVASETFVMTMLIQICSQLDIICYRLKNLPYLYKNNNNNNKRSILFNELEEANIIKDCIVHHNYIYM